MSKKIFSVLLVLIMLASVCTFRFSTEAEAADIITNEGNLYVSKLNGIWAEPYKNHLMLITPGNTVTGLYHHKLYATFDSSKGAYVVQAKVAAHRSYSQTVAAGSIGLALNYDPITTAGSDFARANFEVWNKIRVGDVLTLSGINLTNNTISTSGTWGSDFVSNAAITVRTVRDSAAPTTGYTDKTIVALGDSVTAGGGWTEDVADAIHADIINVATPADRTNEALTRFDKLVAVHNPDIVLIMFAINDCVQYTINSSTLPSYKANLIALYNKCANIGAKVIFMTTNDIKTANLDSAKFASFGGLPAYFPLYQQAIREAANETGAYLIDNYVNWSGLTVANYLIDTVHPNDAGHDIYVNTISAYLLEHEAEIAAGSGGQSGEPVNLGKIYFSKVNGIWAEPYVNNIILLTPGQTLSAFYYHRLCAVYDANKGGYVVTAKYPAHHQITATVPAGGIGIAYNYTPMTAAGREFTMASWEPWCKVRVGDLLTLSGVNVSAGTIETTGTWGAADFTSNAYATVTSTRTPTVTTGYTGKTIVAFGDSITSNGGWTEEVGDLIGQYIINSGIGGYTTTNGRAVFSRDVASKNPDIVFVMFGVNDVLSINSVTPTVYRNNLQYFYDQCTALGAKVIFMTPNNINISYWDSDTYASYGGLEGAFATYRGIMREVAEANGAGFIDHYASWAGLTATDYLVDTVHPNAAGYQFKVDNIYTYLTAHELELTGGVSDPEAFTFNQGVTGYSVDGNFFKGAAVGTLKSAIRGLFKSNVEVLSSSAAALGDSEPVYTGCILRNRFSNDTYEDRILVIAGDLNGDAVLSTADYIRMKRHLKSKEILTGAYLAASDFNVDSTVNTSDYIALKSVLKQK